MTSLYSLASVLFWLLAFVVFYTYLGYGIVIWVLVRLRRGYAAPPAQPVEPLPSVTMVVPAYNERDYLPAKLDNCLAQTYPADKLNLLFVIEGSTDGSAEYLASRQLSIPALSVISGTERLGKIVAMNRAMSQIKTDITIFTDANTTLNREAVSRLVARFAPPSVGAVTGEKRINTEGKESAAGSGEGLYWRYESFLKKLDAQLYTIVGAAGELFAVRTSLYEPVEPDTLLDDFIISLRIAQKGYRVEYAPDAYALERPSHSVSEETKRKVRIATGGFQAIRRLAPLLSVGRYGWLSFQYISHRVLRWAVTPFCLPILLLLNLLLLTQPNVPPLWIGLFWAQILFYIAAGVGYILESRQTRWKLTFVPFYFVYMNVCVLAGFLRYRRGGLSGKWEKSRRAA
ncbi:glycosyltransferase family 2 protein [uncultured Spirosoma sp.]|uniref:glycosyltransferase family 2 protein n=1 Tax=uncultured Spirosoma sp. TaxID=278208 RepID=UPI00258D4344|nr:glycosyltransferase family 2 protein [uncultured Spirosoma sp.]